MLGEFDLGVAGANRGSTVTLDSLARDPLALRTVEHNITSLFVLGAFEQLVFALRSRNPICPNGIKHPVN